MILKKYICRFEKDIVQRYFEYTCSFIVQKGRICKIYGLQSTSKQLIPNDIIRETMENVEFRVFLIFEEKKNWHRGRKRYLSFRSVEKNN